MIITLMNADFSASNIGTLSTWRITRSLGTGATYEGVTSVDKNAAFNATVTIAEGYELGAAGVTVTMGGAPISAAVVDGNTIVISIASVTGNVVIKVPTINLSTGEEEEPVVPDTPIEPEGPTVGTDLTSLFTWSTGSVNATNGATDHASDWVKSDFVPLNGAKSLNLMMIRTTSSSTTKGMAFYDAGQNYISGVVNNSKAPNYMTPELREIEVPSNAAYLRSSWCSTNNQMYNEEISNISHFYCIADGSANTGGQPSNPEVNEPETPVEPTGEEVDITDQFIWTEGSRIIAGGSTDVDSNWKYSDYVDVSEYHQLKVALPVTSVSGSNSSCAFYNENKTHVKSVNISTAAPAMGHEVKTIDIPSGAKYFRTMWYSTNHAAYNPEWTFNCIGVK